MDPPSCSEICIRPGISESTNRLWISVSYYTLRLNSIKLTLCEAFPSLVKILKTYSNLSVMLDKKKNENNFKLRYPRVFTPIDHSH